MGHVSNILRDNVVVSSINEALRILVARGRKVETNPGACVVDGVMHVRIDGTLRSADEIYEMVTPSDKDVYGFEAQGRLYEVHIYFLRGEVAYEIYEDGERLGERQYLDENPLDFVQGVAERMGGASLPHRL